jgi:CubicO group peptidase (beta-lactamase class C family)
MKKLIKITALLLSLSVPCFGVLASDSKSLKQLLDQRINQHKIDIGVVVSLVNDDNGHFEMLGKRNINQDSKVGIDTLFEIGSISKTFTTLVLADMVIKGEVQLDDPVNKYLPVSATLPSNKSMQITLRHLATHTSGLPKMPSNFTPANPNNPYADYTVEDFYHFLTNFTFTREAGVKTEYSNVGVGLLGHVLTLISGQDYESLIRARILDPLEMNSTVIKFSLSDLEKAATGHDSYRAPTGYWDIPTLAGAGAIRSTARDMMKYLKLQMGLIQSNLNEAVALTHQFNTDFMGNMKVGLAWIKVPSSNGYFIMHSGGTGGFASFIGFNPSTNKGIVVLSNSSNSVEVIGMAVMSNKVDKVLAMMAKSKQNDAMSKKTTELSNNQVFSPELLGEYTGKYQLAPGFFLTISNKGDRLFAQVGNHESKVLHPKSTTEFTIPKMKARMTFQRNIEKHVNRMTFSQGGTEITALKVATSSD